MPINNVQAFCLWASADFFFFLQNKLELKFELDLDKLEQF